MRLLKKAARFVPALIVAVLIFLISSRSRLPTPPFAFEGLDKVLHAAAYAVLAGLLIWGAKRPGTRLALGLGLLATVYGASDEWHQSFVPGRESDGWDLLADAAGAVLVVGFYLRRGVATQKSVRLGSFGRE